MRLDARELAAIFAGGIVGALARAGLVEALAPTTRRVAVGHLRGRTSSGAFMLGYFTTRLQERLPLSAYRRPFLGTGLCGALTTFSTMQLELLRMLDDGHGGLAAAYAVASIAAGLPRHRADHQPRAAGEAGRVTALVVVGVGLLGGVGASRASCSTARSPRARRAPSRGARSRSTSAGRSPSGSSHGARHERRRTAARRHRAARRLHDVQHVDARVPPPGRGRARCASGWSTCSSASRSAWRACGSATRSEGRCERRA